MQEIKKSKWITSLVIALLILALIFMANKVGSFFSGLFIMGKKVLTPFLVGLVFAYVLNPIVNFLNRHRIPRLLSILIIYFFFFGFLAILFIKGGPVLIQELRELSDKVPELLLTIKMWAKRMDIQQSILPFSIQGGITHGMNTFGQTVNGFFNGLVTNVDDLLEKVLVYFLIPFIIFYLLKDMKTMHRGVLMLIPGQYRGRISRILHDIDHALGQYIRGQLTVCVILGVLAYIGYKLIGLPYAGVLAIFAGVTNIIPYIGPFIGAAPAILIAATVTWKMALLTVAINLLIQFLEGNVVSPLIVGRTLRLHPLLIIFAVTVGGEVAGITGLIFAVPLVAVGKVIFYHTHHHVVRRPDLPD